MRVLVPDTIALLRPLFTSRLKPTALLDVAYGVLVNPTTGPLAGMGAPFKERERYGYGVMRAVRMDGYDVVESKQMYGLFNPARNRDVSDWQFEQLAAANLPDMVHGHLERCAAALPTRPPWDTLTVLTFPADPAYFQSMLLCHGLSCFAGVPGHILLRLWPDAGNLARLGAVMARAFVHNARHAALGGPTTLADYLATEGLAACFAAACFPDDSDAPWLASFRAPHGWDATLAEIARRYGVASYADLPTNVYGTREDAAAMRATPPAPLEVEELTYAQAVVAESLAATNPNVIAAHLYGDEAVAREGHPPVGLPPFAGFEVAYRWTRAYLARTGQTAGQALLVGAGELLGEDTRDGNRSLRSRTQRVRKGREG